LLVSSCGFPEEWFTLRRRLPSLVLLGLLAGLAVGLVTAAVSGAQRSSSAYPRMREQLEAADAVFFPSQVGIGDADITKLGSIPEVAAWSGFALGPGEFSELGGGAGPFLTVGDGWFRTIERAKVLAGRLPDPSRDDEVVSDLAELDAKARVEELARMLGGAGITAKTRAHAKELFEQSRRPGRD